MVVLLDTFDNDPIGALTTALRRVLVLPGATWTDLLDAAELPPRRRAALRQGDQDALDDLARELNELRTFGPG